MSKYFMLARTTDTGKTVYVTGHRKSSEAYSGVDVHTDPNPRKALLFGSQKNASERAKTLSSDFEHFRVEPYVTAAKVGDVVEDSDEKKAVLAEED